MSEGNEMSSNREIKRNQQPGDQKKRSQKKVGEKEKKKTEKQARKRLPATGISKGMAEARRAAEAEISASGSTLAA